MTTTIAITLDEHTKRRLKQLGAARSRSPVWLMRFAIQQFLDREENYEREKREDLERWGRFQLLGHAIAHDAAAAWLTTLASGEEGPCPE